MNVRPRVPNLGRRRGLVLGALALLLALVLAVSTGGVLFACSQTPTSVPVRTFERAQRMDVACLQLYEPSNPSDPNSAYVTRQPLGRAQAECAPIPQDGRTFVKHLFALVTQTSRGELAVVDLSAGGLVDLSRTTPGINFIPVGSLPTDVATTPDGKMAFVGSAEPNKAAIYGIPTRRILGDTSGFPRDPDPVTLASWPVCALPQSPGALSVVPRRLAPAPVPVPADAGDAGDAGGDAGAPADDGPDYVLVAVLPGDRRSSAKVVTIDPRPFRRGALARTPDNKPDYASDHLAGEPATLTDGPTLQPGELAPCPILSAIELVGATAVPSSVAPSATWDDGVKYVDGGADLTCLRPAQADRCGLPACCGGDASAEAGTCTNATQDAGAQPLDLGPLDPPHLVSVARDDQTLYIADEGVPLIHVIDMSTPGAPRELAPLVATSVADPSRTVKIKALSVSPPTRSYQRFLYAVDGIEGSLMIYDVTDPSSSQRTPILRPHPELNPFQPADRLAFTSPVVAVSFARHDLPLSRLDGVPIASAASGLLCNPNHNLDATNPKADLGFYYRASSPDPGQDIGPRRLRGIFAFATLANGQVVAINVDDWDGPCRRPGNMLVATSDIAPPQPITADIDPYHAPALLVPGAKEPTADPNNLAVTNEAFFPMSPPHSLRSSQLIRNDVSTGNQVPHLSGQPSVSSNGVILAPSGFGSDDTPLLGVQFALEDPQVHIDQDWSATYEGAIPGFDGMSATLATLDNFSSIVMTQPQARFCTKGVEDWAQASERSRRITAEIVSNGGKAQDRADRLMTDYVELTEDMLDPSDPYWALDQPCWDPSLATPAKRQDACVRTYGAASDESPQRDFPIVEAYNDRVVLGRFFTTPEGRREVVYKDPSNAASLKLMQCCFHHQARFKVRTAQVWSVVGGAVGGGAGVGFFSHLTTDDAGRCVPSCDPRESLLNARIPTVPNLVINKNAKDPRDPSVLVTTARRNSALAMRNPMFTAGILGPVVDPATKVAKVPARDTVYRFSTRGGFQTLVVSIAGASISVNPQSMRYIESFGQMAVVDGASQGLVLIDLRAVTVARAPYF